MAKPFNPGGTPGKLHREIGVPVGQKIPAKKLGKAMKSSNPTIKRDAERAKTMEGWKHGGHKPQITTPVKTDRGSFGVKG